MTSCNSNKAVGSGTAGRKQSTGFVPGVRRGLVACCWLVFGPMSDLNANFKKVKKLVTSEPIETKEVTNFFVNRKIKELKPK
jgi:hypothetical protein